MKPLSYLLTLRLSLALTIGIACSNSFAFDNGVNPIYEAPRVIFAPKIDGVPNDLAWSKAQWRPIAYTIIDAASAGEPDANDISGQYKVVWTKHALYLLAQIKDDRSIDDYPNPFDNWWNEDTLEIFIDEDNSGGYHGWEPVMNNPELEHNAYAYHISLDNQALDVGPNYDLSVVGPQHYPEHITARWIRDPETFDIFWEVKISVFNDQYLPAPPDASNYDINEYKVKLKKGKMLGFMVSLIDADGTDLSGDGKQDREYFMGDVDVQPWQPEDGGYPMPEWVDKNRGWIDADVFGNILLVH